MNRLFIILALISFWNLDSFGQQKPNAKPEKIQEKSTPDERAEKRASVLKKQLSLTDEQTTQVRQLILERDRKHVAQREKIKANQEEFLSGIDKILNEEQRKKFKEIQEERKNRAQEHRAQGQKPRKPTPPAEPKQ
jgi:hypothetical protein